jgi:hypothetical protein
MQRIITPALLGLGAARHLAWYISHQVGCSPREGD